MNHPQIESLSSAIGDLSGELRGLQGALGKYNSFTANPFNSALSQIENQANSALQAVNDLTGAVGGVSGGGRPGGETGFGGYMSKFESPLVSLGMMPIEWLRDRIGVNRNVSLASAGAFSQVARQQGTDVASIMGQLARFPGQVQGTPTDLMQLFSVLPSLGAGFGFGGQAGQGVRAAGMLAGVRQAQLLNPGEQMGSIIQNIGGFAANTQAQQQAQMLTGGAMGMIGAGGRQKSLSQWAEDTLRWLEGLRGGGNRGKPFNYGELIAQQFPGSNIDAWFQANGVPQEMRQYWWTYALQKANKTGTTGGGPMEITPDTRNLAQARLGATTELTRTEMNVGGKMTPQYVTRETMNQWFNSMMGQIQETLFSKLLGPGGIGNIIQYLPDTIEDALFGGLQMGAGAVDSALQSFGGIGNIMQLVAMMAAPAADVEGWPAGAGDIGDIGGGYGMLGGTGLSGLSPNMKSKLGPMMRANPRLRISSGLRDTAMQARLKEKGYRTTGGPSAHTRGDAADLGPASQYPWIVANASKFGLRSGIRAGEPWHVGVGDIPGMGLVGGALDWGLGQIGGSIPGVSELQTIFKLLGTVSKMFGSFDAGGMGMFGGMMPAFGQLALGGGIGGPGGLLGALGGLGSGESGGMAVTKGILNMLLGPFAGEGAKNIGGWGGYPDEGMGRRLATQQITIGGLPSKLMGFGSGGGGLGGWLGKLVNPLGINPLNPLSQLTIGPRMLGAGFDLAGGALGALQGVAGASFSGVPSERAMTVARLASQYWQGEDLIKAVAISGRESSWDPKAHRTDHRPKDPKYGDRGLFQINYSLDPGFIREGLYHNPSDLFDPATNIRAAYELWKDAGGSWKPWAMTAHGWDKNGDPLYGAKVEEARAAIHSAGVGDVERMQYSNFSQPDGRSMVMHVSGNTISVSDQAVRSMLGGGGSQIDIRRTVSLIADYLEDEMNRRMARTN